jgi:hypothetical protein
MLFVYQELQSISIGWNSEIMTDKFNIKHQLRHVNNSYIET